MIRASKNSSLPPRQSDHASIFTSSTETCGGYEFMPAVVAVAAVAAVSAGPVSAVCIHAYTRC
jgi:hypothetical protein